MNPARLIWSLLLCLLALPAFAAPKPLSTDEIRALLTGNTVHGTWAGKEYFSYFEANGWTTYVEPGKPSTQGRWQPHGDKYCSKWGEMGSETCYALEMDGDTLLWVTSAGARYPSKVLPGDQLPK
jgi:hypothetical protein